MSMRGPSPDGKSSDDSSWFPLPVLTRLVMPSSSGLSLRREDTFLVGGGGMGGGRGDPVCVVDRGGAEGGTGGSASFE